MLIPVHCAKHCSIHSCSFLGLFFEYHNIEQGRYHLDTAWSKGKYTMIDLGKQWVKRIDAIQNFLCD